MFPDTLVTVGVVCRAERVGVCGTLVLVLTLLVSREIKLEQLLDLMGTFGFEKYEFSLLALRVVAGVQPGIGLLGLA
jgi:hypothetical protein